MEQPTLHLIGYASGVAGADNNQGNGPIIIQQSAYFADLVKQGVSLKWEEILKLNPEDNLSVEESVATLCHKLAKMVSRLVQQHQAVNVIGGDHTSAIGTWSGVYDALHKKGDIGLIWIDAHMDSHTPQTTESGHVHGMPVACLLGQGHSALTSILHTVPKIKPENICLIGVRSYESGEAEFLKQQNVRVYFMDEVKERGFSVVLQEAIKQVTQRTVAYGLSIDIDGLDPIDAPAVDVPEPDGIRLNDLYNGLSGMLFDPRLVATEIVEFDPKHDKNRATEKIIVNLINMIANRKAK